MLPSLNLYGTPSNLFLPCPPTLQLSRWCIAIYYNWTTRIATRIGGLLKCCTNKTKPIWKCVDIWCAACRKQLRRQHQPRLQQSSIIPEADIESTVNIAAWQAKTGYGLPVSACSWMTGLCREADKSRLTYLGGNCSWSGDRSSRTVSSCWNHVRLVT